MQYSLIAEACPECKKLSLISYRDGLEEYKKCKECGYREEIPPECKKGCCDCCSCCN